ncbi:MAG TPA: hypothetical protein ACFYEK_04550 [Candidatus Wunengus sp. YC60]|jgi:hypothetical protein|uniref:hypothetical protein n=1 Tax=Candidatus Wunengus sp. YC60 TaxID=3367697 RepID=UPI0040299BBE
MNISEIQEKAVAWHKKNFGEYYGSGYRYLLGICEEASKLCRIHLKGEQGIRHTPEEIINIKTDAIGYIIIFLCNYCDSQNFALEDCICKAWKREEK